MRTDNDGESSGVSMGRPFGDHSIVDDALWAKLTAAVAAAAAAAATLDAPGERRSRRAAPSGLHPQMSNSQHPDAYEYEDTGDN